MSLMRLLAVGRSIGAIRDEPTRYKMAEENALPHFGPMKELEPRLESVESPSRACGETGAAGEDGSSKTEPAAETKSEMKTETLEQSQNSAETEGGMLRKVASPWRGWSLLGNPFKRNARAKSGGPVQVELALDMIKPVRNDLNDTDLEILPAKERVEEEKPEAAPEVAPVAAGPKMNLGRMIWDRLRAGWMRFRTRQP